MPGPGMVSRNAESLGAQTHRGAIRRRQVVIEKYLRTLQCSRCNLTDAFRKLSHQQDLTHHKYKRPIRRRTDMNFYPYRFSFLHLTDLHRQPFQLRSQLLERRVKSTLDRAQRDLERIGDLLKRHVFEFLHYHNLS